MLLEEKMHYYCYYFPLHYSVVTAYRELATPAAAHGARKALTAPLAPAGPQSPAAHADLRPGARVAGAH